MKRLIAFLIGALLLALVVPPRITRVAGQEGELAATEGHIYRAENPVPEQYNVVLRNDIRGPELEAVAYEFAQTYEGQVLRFFYQTSLNGFAMQIKESAALALSRDARVEFVSEVDASNPLLEESKPLETEEEQTLPVEEATPITEETDTKPPVGGKTGPPIQEETTPPTAEETTPPTEEPPPPTGEEVTLPGGLPSPGNMDELNLVANLPLNPTENLGLASDPRYFKYGGQTIALLGISGSFVPHVVRYRQRPSGTYDPVIENCTFDQIGGTAANPVRKYQVCVQQLRDAGLNHLQIWVSMNHSLGRIGREVGTNQVSEPYPNEQPFSFEPKPTPTPGPSPTPTPAPKKWHLNKFDQGFFNNLKEVVQYCQNKGIIVAVVLFDPWQGWEDEPTTSPWHQSNNYSPTYPNGVSFTNPDNVNVSDHDLIIMSDKPTADPTAEVIDTNAKNKYLRSVQVSFIKKAADTLKNLKNFYWVLANEADIRKQAARGKQIAIWHKYMARILRTYEHTIYGSNTTHHLIAANVASNGTASTVIDTLRQDGNIDIINSHYVRLLGTFGGVSGELRYGGMELLRKWNDYDDAGAPKGFNNRRWGFTEDKASGVILPPNVPDGDDNWTADNVRVAAWEFLLNGGAIYDHLSYRWGNLPDDSPFNAPQARKARQYLGYLGKFMNTFDLAGMKRLVVTNTTTNQLNRWIDDPPTYGEQPSALFWAAMSSTATPTNPVYLFYAHRSNYLGINFDRYQAYTGTANDTTNVTINVKKLSGAGCYQAQWFYPRGEVIQTKGGVTADGNLIAAKTEKFPYTSTTKRPLTSPPYRQDVVLKITKLSANTQPCGP